MGRQTGTVEELRAESAKRGLPKFQRDGRRLTEDDHVAQIIRYDRIAMEAKP